MAETLTTPTETYESSMYGKKEVELVDTFIKRKDDAQIYFLNCIKPRLDRSYKLYMSDNSDRAKELLKNNMAWKANISVPYIHGTIETLKPRILDARPEFTVQGRNEEDQNKASKIQATSDYTWEIAGGDDVAELVTSASLIFGMGYMQPYWKRDVRELKFLSTKKIDKKKYDWKKEKKVFYDAPAVEWVDNYSLWYDWHNIAEENKQDWFKRLLLPAEVIKRRYPSYDKKRLKMAFQETGDLTDYGNIRTKLKLAHEKITKGADYASSTNMDEMFKNANSPLHEVFEWTRPFDDSYSVMVNNVPILKGGSIPFPYNFKESPFIGTPYLKVPGEYEGYGLPLLLENPQIMLNTIKNQRLDAATLNIHKMWIINPLANINKEDLVVRPFGIVYSIDPNGAREISMTDIKPSAYRETEELKGDMRYASGVDDSSMGGGGASGSATETRHLRESTLERVRLFVNHLGSSYAKLMRFWISMWGQFMTKEMAIRITGDDGNLEFPIILKDDLMGYFDFKATVIPSIAGQNDVKKKQDMDLFQLLVEMPFINPEKLTSKVLHDWNWNIDSIRKEEEEEAPVEETESPTEMLSNMPVGSGQVPENIAQEALAMISGAKSGETYVGEGARRSSLSELSSPVNLLKETGAPPTVEGVGKTTNSRGMNRTGKVNTNIAKKAPNGEEAQLMNRVSNTQR